MVWLKNAIHGIELKEGSKPIRSRPNRLSCEEDDYLKNELKSFVNLGIIKSSSGKWSSPILFVKKKGGELRMVVDYRKLNEMTIKDAYPLPHIDDIFSSLGGAQIFSTMDAARGFWKIPLDEEAKELSGFVTKYGTYEFQVMPFGLTNAPSTFQRTMTNTLSDFIGEFVLVSLMI